jgi:hypothetical protein
MDEALFLQHGHVVAHGRRRHPETGAVRPAPWSPPARRCARSPGRWPARRPGDARRSRPSSLIAVLRSCVVAAPRHTLLALSQRRVPSLRAWARGLLSRRDPAGMDRYGRDVLAGRLAYAAAAGAPSRCRPSRAWSSRTSRPAGAAPSCASRRPAACTSSTSRTGTGAPAGSRSARVPVDGAPVILTPPSLRCRPPWPPLAPGGASRTASGSVAVTGAARQGRHRLADLGRGQARRRTGREGVGRRPAGRGVVVEMLDGVDDLMPRRSVTSARRRAVAWESSSTTSCRAPRSRRSSTRSARARRPPRPCVGARPPLCRCLAVGEARPARLDPVAGHPPWHVRGSTASAGARLAARHARPTSRWPGAASSARCDTMPTSSQLCSRASRNS